MTKTDLQAAAVRLRIEERLPLREIVARLKVAKSSAWQWLLPYPLSKEELAADRKGIGGRQRKIRDRESLVWEAAKERHPTRRDVGNAAEAATLYRLTLLGLPVYRAVFEGAKADWLIELPNRRIIRIGVRSARPSADGLPMVNLECRDYRVAGGRRLLEATDIDLLLAFDVRADVAYVYRFQDLPRQSNMRVNAEAREAWHRLDDLAQ